ncbi:MAG: hypothetical protein GKR89_01565 [Candidatus Latescibacteria bacterium]|nr:hypothetical protein [Candidatus Latescibacterota bacterium]
MGTAFWFTIQVGQRTIPVPLLVLLPLAFLLDVLLLIGSIVYVALQRHWTPLLVALQLPLSRLVLNLLLHGGRLGVNVRDGKNRVSLFGGWGWRRD